MNCRQYLFMVTQPKCKYMCTALSGIWYHHGNQIPYFVNYHRRRYRPPLILVTPHRSLLICVYFDVLINRLTQSRYGCYIGLVFLAVCVYADDIALLAPTATAMRHLLSICDIFATDFDVIFNAQQTKCVFLDSAVSHLSYPLLTFYVGNNVIKYVDSWPHLGHILPNNWKCDNDDIKRCYLSVVRQINEIICYFRNMNSSTKLKLLYSFCSSLYGAELWDLSNCDFECITVAWRKALKRVWSLPWRTF